jgi:hypothetical protein
VTDPEDVTRLRPLDLEEVEVDETPESERDIPLEADPADVLEQRDPVDIDDDDDRREG